MPSLRSLRLHSILAAALLVAAAPTATLAATAKKEMTPQQQKMKDCSAKWGEEKKTKKVSGKKAHNEFMSTCLKS
jgi:Ni/Co efflux regulator RcnB